MKNLFLQNSTKIGELYVLKYDMGYLESELEYLMVRSLVKLGMNCA